LINTYRTLITLASSVIIMSLSACVVGGNYVPADSVAKAVETFQVISPSNNLTVGNQIKLTPVIRQADGNSPENPEIVWTVSDEKIAKVEKDGTITALADGNITITAKYKDQSASTTLAINKAPAVPTDIKEPQGPTIQANPALLSLIKNIVIKLPNEATPVTDYNFESLDVPLNFQVQAFDADNKVISGITFSWSSSNTTVATVSNTGKVTALASGTSNIIATAGDKTSNLIRVIVPNGKINVNVNFQGD
jgi:uncharacterized protein YjdB